MYPAVDPLPIFDPLTLSISDQYGESIVLSKSEETGDVLQLTVKNYVKGLPTVLTLAGNFHTNRKQNAINTLARLSNMVALSQQDHQSLLLICPQPQIQMRGRLTNLSGPDWASTPSPRFYTYSFDFTKDTEDRQPLVFREPGEVISVEGNNYVNF